MRQDIQRHFTALGLSPGASANDIRVAYRKLIQQWHPDRFAVGSLMQTTAEDHTKELNEAYESLYKKRHYRKYLATAAKARPVARPAAGGEEEEAKPNPPKPARPGPQSSRWPSFLRSRRGWEIAAMAVGLGASAAVVGLLLRSPAAARRKPWVAAFAPAATPASPPVAAAPPPAAASAAPVVMAAPDRVRTRITVLDRPAMTIPLSATKVLDNSLRNIPPVPPTEWDQRLDASEAELDTFEMGDSLERVKIVQGMPDETTTGAFRYGSSLVFFENGKVSGWINGVPRLRIPLLSFADWQDDIDAVTMGSSRGEVFKVQGRPDEVFADAYYYGTDAVYFDRDRVVNWIRTDNRLRTRFLSDLPVFKPSLPR